MNAQATQRLAPETVKVGDGVTMYVGSDSYAGTVTKVSPSGKTIEWTMDEAKRVDSNGAYTEDQTYEYTSVEPYDNEHPHFPGQRVTNIRVARWSAKRNGFVYQNSRLGAGRRAHYDPHF